MQKKTLFISKANFLYKLISILLCFSLLLAGCSINPSPLTEQEIKQRTINDLASMQDNQEVLDGQPISLYDAMARALKYNLDHRLKIMEEALAASQLDLARYDLLPEITESAGYNVRNNNEGSFSQSLLDGSQSLVASTSSEKKNRTMNVSIMWNILDFGVSYARAKQQADRVLIIEERRRKVIQNILQDVRYAYWRAVSAEHLIQEMVTLLGKTKMALKHAQQVADLRLQSPKESLEYQKELLENIRLLWSIIQNLTPAKTELAALMNLKPGTPFHLTDTNWQFPEIPSFTLPIEKLEQIALTSRPELREEDYRFRISAHDARNSILKLMPGVSLELNESYNSNSFLYNSAWWNAGAMVSQSLVKLFSVPKAIKAAQAQLNIDQMRRQAVSMAVLVQTNLAYQRYGLAKKEYYVARHLEHISRQLNEQAAVEHSVGGSNELESIKSHTNTLIAKMRHYQAYSELQNSVGRIYNTLGVDLLPTIESTDLKTLAVAIEESIMNWQESVNVKLAEGEDPVSRDIIPGIPDAEFGIEENIIISQAIIPESGLKNSEKQTAETMVKNNLLSQYAEDTSENTEEAVDENYLEDNFYTPSPKRYTTFIRQKADTEDDVAVEENKLPEESETTGYIIKIRSDPTPSDILRSRLLGEVDENSVEVKMKSRGLSRASWLKKRSVDNSYNTSVNIPIKSPLSITRISRP